jgi:hypothetical protein
MPKRRTTNVFWALNVNPGTAAEVVYDRGGLVDML